MLDENTVCVMSDFQIIVFDIAAKAALCVFKCLPQVQEHLILHPQFNLQTCPLVIAQNPSSASGLSVHDMTNTNSKIGQVELPKQGFTIHQLLRFKPGANDVKVIGKYEGETNFCLVTILAQ